MLYHCTCYGIEFMFHFPIVAAVANGIGYRMRPSILLRHSCKMQLFFFFCSIWIKHQVPYTKYVVFLFPIFFKWWHIFSFFNRRRHTRAHRDECLENEVATINISFHARWTSTFKEGACMYSKPAVYDFLMQSKCSGASEQSSIGRCPNTL